METVRRKLLLEPVPVNLAWELSFETLLRNLAWGPIPGNLACQPVPGTLASVLLYSDHWSTPQQAMSKQAVD